MRSTHILLAAACGALLLMHPVSASTSAAGAASADEQAPQRPAPPQYPGLPSETPSTFEPVTDSFDYVKRDVMIPMRDGVKLHTVILVPKGARRAPILLTRTPYNANRAHQLRAQRASRRRCWPATTTHSK